MTTGLPLEWGDVRGVVDGLAAGDAPLDCISARRAFDRELDPDDEELDRLGVGMLGAGDVDSLGTEEDRGVVDGLAAGDAPLACISARRAFDRELDPDDEELDRLGVGMLGAGLEDRVGAGAGRELLRDALDGGATDGVLGRRVCAECSICRSADELLLLLRDGVLGRADEGAGRLGDWILGVGRLGAWNFGVDLEDDRDVEEDRGTEKDLVAADDERDRDADPPLDRE